MHLQMAKVQIVGPKSLFLDVVSYLHNYGLLHVENISREILDSGDDLVKPMEVDSAQVERRKQLENAIVKINGIISTLKGAHPALSREKEIALYKELWLKTVDELLAEVDQIVGGVEAKALALSEKRSTMESELAMYEKYEPILIKIQPLAKQLCTYQGFESMALLLDKGKKAGLEALKQELKNLCKNQCDLVYADVDDKNIGVIIIYNKTYHRTIHDFLAMEEVNEIKLPSGLANESFDMALVRIQNLRKNMPSELAKINEELEGLSIGWHSRITTLRNVLKDREEEIKMIPQFGSTMHTFVINGWMPNKEIEKSRQALTDEFFGKVALVKLEVSHHEMERAPVSLVNPKWAKPFEYFYGFVKMPKYGGVDPTSFMAIFFPIIFGMMVGDVGYGLVILWIASRFTKASKGDDVMAVFGGVLKMAAYGAIVWGVMYMEVFGSGLELLLAEFGIHIFAHPIFILGVPFPFNRMEFMKELLVLSIVMGVIHIGAGLLFGVINGLREHNTHHVQEKLGTLIVLVIGPLFLVIGGLTGLSFITLIGAVGMLVGLVMAAMGGGIKGIVEILGAASNIFSYARIMAIGLAGVILGVVANEMGMKIGGIGGFAMKAIGIFMAVFLHIVNIVVSAFSPSIHTLRLHLVECFTKFFEPAESEYKPFKKIGGE